MDNLDSTTWFFVSIIAFIITLWILHEIIKSGVKSGMIAADREIQRVKNASDNTQTIQKPQGQSFSTREHMELQKKYERGEITFEEYQKSWEAK